MTGLDYLIAAVGVSLQLCILIRGFQTKAYKSYGFFYAAVGYGFLQSFAMTYFLVFGNFPALVIALWSRSLSPLVGFLVTWEIYRQVFSAVPQIRRRAGKIISLVLLVLAGFTFAADFAARPLSTFPYLAIEWQSRVAQGAFLALTLILAKYYLLPMGKNIWGMAAGFGLFVSVGIANFAFWGEFGSKYAIIGRVQTLSSLVAFGIWCWSLWRYGAPAKVSEKPLPELSESQRDVVEAAWARAFEALKKGFGR